MRRVVPSVMRKILKYIHKIASRVILSSGNIHSTSYIASDQVIDKLFIIYLFRKSNLIFKRTCNYAVTFDVSRGILSNVISFLG